MLLSKYIKTILGSHPPPQDEIIPLLLIPPKAPLTLYTPLDFGLRGLKQFLLRTCLEKPFARQGF